MDANVVCFPSKRAYRSIEKASRQGKIAESDRHVVTLVKTNQELVVGVEEAIPDTFEVEPVLEEEEG
jgi:hypothetical protein